VSVARPPADVSLAPALGTPARVSAQTAPTGVIETKLAAPLVRPGTVARGELVDRLTPASASSVAGIFAPAGYGKTTLLAQVIARERRPVAWVSVDEGDNDPMVLLLHVAVAIHRVVAVKPALIALLSSPGPFEPLVIHRVCSELSMLPEHVLVLDDVHLVSGSFSRDAIAALAVHAAQGSLLVLSGRGSEGLPIARLRATGRLLEIGAADLALDEAETRGVLKHRLSGPLCDAVLQTGGSARKLEELERSNLNVVPLDRTREWYRYHHLLRDALRSELVRRDAVAIPRLHRRAAAWLEDNGEPVAAVDHALAAGDLDHAARLIAPLVLVLERTGRGATTRRWLDALGPEAVEQRPELALAAGWFAALGGEDIVAQRWLAIAARRSAEGFPALGAASAASAVALLRATICPAGVAQMREDAEFVADSEELWGPWRPIAIVLLGFAHVLAGEDRRAEEVLAQGVREASRVDGHHIWAPALAQLALYALERGELSDADALARQAREQSVPATATANGAFVLVASARVAQRRGDSRRLAEYVAGVQLRRPQLTAARPWISSLTLLQLARVHVASGDSAGVRTILRDLNDLLRERPDLGIVGGVAERLAEQARALPITGAGATTLTPAELRLLPLLPTHLSFPEIGARLFLSRHTVKTQSTSIYRKLDVSSRGEAVVRARAVGLLDEFVRDTSTAE
jgi:ATP/maltotriose-dependent transcriptional regulator MalT